MKSETPPQVEIWLMGASRLWIDGVEQSEGIRNRKSWALLTYLIAERERQHRRDQLAELFWPEVSEQGARVNLRQAIFEIRQAFSRAGINPDQLFEVNRQSLAFRPDPALALTIDLLRFEKLLGLIDRPCGAREIADALAALDPLPWLRGELLAQEDLDALPELGQWLRERQQRHRHQLLALIDKLGQLGQEGDLLNQAVSLLQRLAELDPYGEHAQTLAMRLYARANRRELALESYEAFRQRLFRDLGEQPSEALQALHGEIAAGPAQPGSPVRPTDGGWLTHPKSYKRWATVVCIQWDPLDENWDDRETDIEDFLRERASRLREGGGEVQQLPGLITHVIFGWPQPREGSANMAVLSVRQLLEALHEMPDAPLSARIGIESGLLRIGREHPLPDTHGPVSIHALRQAWQAGRNGAIVGTNARRNLGIEIPEPLFHGHSATPPPSDERLAPAPIRPPGQLPDDLLLERETVLARLDMHWQECRANLQSRALLVIADPGLGKTTLVRHFCRQVETQQGRVLTVSCRRELSHSPMAAVLNLLRAVVQIRDDDPRLLRQARLRRYLEMNWPDRAAVLYDVLAAILLENEPLARLPAREHVHDILLELLEARAERQPTLMIVDDLHWSDGATLDLLNDALRRLRKVPLMLLLTSRPGPVTERLPEQTSRVELPALSEAACRQLLAQRHPLTREWSSEQRQALIDRAAGNPLYLNEMARLAGESGHAETDLPGSMMEMIQTHMAGLARETQALLHLAALLGYHFSQRELAPMLDPDRSERLQTRLGEALNAGLIDPDGPEQFRFRHPVVQDAIAAGLAPMQRRHLHQRIAEQLIALKQPPEQVAHHLEQAGRKEAALKWWTEAGLHAAGRHLNSDALAHFERAEALAADCPEEPVTQRIHRALARGQCLLQRDGMGSKAARSLFEEILTLTRHGNQFQQARFTAMAGLYMGDSSASEHAAGLKRTTQMLRMARDDAQTMTALHGMANSLFWRGRFDDAERYQRQGLDLARTMGRQASGQRYLPDDPAVSIRAFHAWTLKFLDQPEQARQVMDEAVAIARADPSRHTLALALSFSANLHRWEGEARTCRQVAQEILSLGRQYDYSLWAGVGQLLILWAEAHVGEPISLSELDQAVRQMREGYPGGAVTALSICAETCHRLGDHRRALTLAEEALANSRRLAETYFDPLLLRLKAQCLETLDTAPSAEVSPRKLHEQALKIARKQHSRWAERLLCETP